MSELDDLEDIGEQSRYGYNQIKRGIAKGSRKRLKRAQQRGGAENRSLDKQQYRSSDRRGVLAID